MEKDKLKSQNRENPGFTHWAPSSPESFKSCSVTAVHRAPGRHEALGKWQLFLGLTFLTCKMGQYQSLERG